jgi:hypothetical protein
MLELRNRHSRNLLIFAQVKSVSDFGQNWHDLRKQFAEYLHAGGPVLIINENNNNGGWISLTEALAKDLCFTIKVRDDVIAIDIDGSEGLIKALEFSGEHSGYPCLVCESGGGGSGHLYLRVKDPMKRRMVSEEAKKAGFDVRKIIRPPYVLHRSGKSYSLPISDQRGIGPEKVFTKDLISEREVERRIIHGWDKGKRSKGLYWLACVFISHGKSESEYVSTVLDHRTGCGEKVASLSDARASNYLSRTYLAAKDKASVTSSLESVQRKIGEWIDCIACDSPALLVKYFSVIVGICNIAARSRSLELDLSVREVAEQSGCCRTAASAALKKLREAGLLKQTVRATRRCRHAARYRLGKKSGHTCLNTPPIFQISVSENIELILNSLDRKPMQRNIILMYYVLGGEFVKSLRKSDPKVEMGIERTLRMLAKVNLAKQEDGRWIVDFDFYKIAEIAVGRGTVERNQQRKDAHRRERDNFNMPP